MKREFLSIAFSFLAAGAAHGEDMRLELMAREFTAATGADAVKIHSAPPQDPRGAPVLECSKCAGDAAKAGVSYSERRVLSHGVNLFSRSWRPRGDEKASLVIVHGLKDHGERYGTTAVQLAQLGY